MAGTGRRAISMFYRKRPVGKWRKGVARGWRSDDRGRNVETKKERNYREIILR